MPRLPSRVLTSEAQKWTMTAMNILAVERNQIKRAEMLKRGELAYFLFPLEMGLSLPVKQQQ